MSNPGMDHQDGSRHVSGGKSPALSSPTGKLTSLTLAQELPPPIMASSTKTSFSISPIGTPTDSPLLGPLSDALNSFPPSPYQPPSASLSSAFPSSGSAMSTVLGENGQSKSPGLVRRISHKGARHARDMLRSRPSNQNIRNSRDQSSGPWIRRGRTSSKTSYDAEFSIDTSMKNEITDSEFSPLDTRTTPTPSSIAALSRASSRKPSRLVDEYPPVIPASLQTGTQITKITKNSQKPMHITLDAKAAKVTWKSQRKAIYLDDIEEVRRGKISQENIENLALPSTFNVDLCVEIISSDKNKRKPIKTLFAIFESDEEATQWADALGKLTKYRQDLMTGVAGPGLDIKTLRGRWDQEMDEVHGASRQPGQESLDLAGIQRICHSLHINWSNKDIEHRFREADKENLGHLNYDQFRAFVKAAKERSEVMKLFLELKRNTADGLELEPFLRFLEDQQGIPVSANRTTWENVFHKFVTDDKYNEAQNPGGDLVMGFYAFNAFISSSHNSAIILDTTDSKLDRPLNEYFISSSHNTYLLGHQIVGYSSTEGYVKALTDGCRCIEIDCWDRGNQPVVTHGHTRTTWILFEDCVRTIAQFAFEATEYPLILSLEVHCNDENQQRMVDIMVKEFGDMLVREPISPGLERLPSPEELKFKILIKVKTNPVAIPIPPTPRSIRSPATRRQRSISTPIAISPSDALAFASSDTSKTSLDLAQTRTIRLNSDVTTITVNSISSASEEDDLLSPTSEVKPKTPRSKIIESLGRLGVYTQGLRYKGVFSTDTYNHIFSLSEKTFDGACKEIEKCQQMEKHNMSHLMRIYPGQMRLRSSNMDPLACWKRGVQMVALNYQTYDEAMHLNEAMFSSGVDRTGYVLKPSVLRPAEQMSDHVLNALAPRNPHRIDFSIDLISAQFLPKSDKAPMMAPSPYVEIKVYIADDKQTGSIIAGGGEDGPPSRDGAGRSCMVHCRRSQIVRENGHDPKFNDMFKFSVRTRFPELVFVRFSVWNSSDGKTYNNGNESEMNKPDATFTVKLRSLQTGYRHLPLRTPKGEQFFFSTLFCKISRGEELEIMSNESLSLERLSLWKRAGQRIGFGKRTGSTER